MNNMREHYCPVCGHPMRTRGEVAFHMRCWLGFGGMTEAERVADARDWEYYEGRADAEQIQDLLTSLHN